MAPAPAAFRSDPWKRLLLIIVGRPSTDGKLVPNPATFSSCNSIRAWRQSDATRHCGTASLNFKLHTYSLCYTSAFVETQHAGARCVQGTPDSQRLSPDMLSSLPLGMGKDSAFRNCSSKSSVAPPEASAELRLLYPVDATSPPPSSG